MVWYACTTELRRFVVAGVGNHMARDGDDNASGIALHCNWTIGTWKLGLLFFHVSASPSAHVNLQELRGVLNKQLRVLVLRTMIAVGVQNELRVRQVLLQYERVHRIDEHVVAAFDHERRLSDLLQVGIGILRR